MLQLPVFAEVLSVDIQRGCLVLWAKLETMNDLESRMFYVIATGQEVSYSNIKFIGTTQSDNGLVYHIFEQLGGPNEKS